MSTITRIARAACVLAFVAACEAPLPDVPTPATITSFTASERRVPAGDAATLSWALAGEISRVELFRGAESLVQSTEAEGSLEVADVRAGSNRFLLVVTGRDGGTAHAETEVIGVTAAEVVAFSASRTEAPAGAAVFLSWRTLLADTAEIYAGDTRVETITGAEVANGSRTVRPTTTTTYTLKAIGLAGTAESQVSVVVTAAPVFTTTSVEPDTVARGETVTLTWATERAASLSIRSGARVLATVGEEEVAVGERTFTVDASQAFTLVAAGPGGTETVELPVTVRAPATVIDFVAQPPEVVVGGEVTLAWNTKDADALTLTANGVEVELETAELPSGSVTLTPTEPTLYELRVEGPGGGTRATVFVQVHGAPTIESFDATPRATFRRRDPTVLSWTTKNVVSVSVATLSGEVIDLGPAAAASGTANVYPDEDSTYVLTATGPGGTVQSAPVSVTVAEPPPLVVANVLRNPINRGMTSELSWRIVEADSFTIEESLDGETFTPIDVSDKGAEDAIPTVPEATTTYRIRATNEHGTTEKILVQTVVNPPAVKRFVSDGKRVQPDSPSAVFITMHEPVTFTWETTDAYGVLLDPGIPQPDVDARDNYEFDAPEYVSLEGLEGTESLAVPTSTTGSGMLEVVFPGNFRFPFFGTEYASVNMYQAGFLCFGATGSSNPCSTSGSTSNSVLPNTSQPHNTLAVFWDSLRVVPGKTQWFMRMDGLPPNRTVTLEWSKMDFSNTGANELTFKVVLHESGFWELWNAPRTVGTSSDRWGAGATIGLEMSDSTTAADNRGETISHNSNSALCSSFEDGVCTPITRVRPKLLPPSGSAVRYYAPTNFVANSRTFSLRAIGPLGHAKSGDILATISRKPRIDGFTVDKTHIGAGESVRFEWNVFSNPAADFDRVEIRDSTGLKVPIADPTQRQGNVVFSPTRTETWTLYAINKAGFEVASVTTGDDETKKSKHILLDAPIIQGLKVTPDQGAMNDAYTFSWAASSGIDSLELLDPDGTRVVLLPGSDPAIAARSLTRTDLVKPGTYTLVAHNGSGRTEAAVSIAIATDLRILDFKSNVEEQTTGKAVRLSWETYNGGALEISGGTRTHTSGTRAEIRKGSSEIEMGSDDTTYTLTVKRNAAASCPSDDCVTATVFVKAAPKPSVLSFNAVPATPLWNEPFSIRWETQNATTVRVERIIEADAPGNNNPKQVAVAKEYVEARDLAAGEISLSVEGPARFRIVVENSVGDQALAYLSVNPEVTTPQLTFTVSPTDMPRGGYTNLSWTATQTDHVMVFRREAGEVNELPYDYQPYGFVDISQTGTELKELRLADTSNTLNYQHGFAIVPFPDAFRPPYFGTPMAAMLVAGGGVLTLSDDPNAPGKNGCAATSTSANTCGASTLAAPPNSAAPNAYLAVFQGSLSRCAGASGANCPAGRTPGKLFWQLVGKAPNRTMIVQWDNWDWSSTSNAGTLTFQAKIHENGDVEYQYKRLANVTGDPRYAGGGHNFVGLENLDGTFGLRLQGDGGNQPFLSDGDGYRFYTGRQPRVGAIRSRFIPPSSTNITQVHFRASASNAETPTTPTTVRRSLSLMHGVNELVLNELMIDPEDGNDVGKEWIEILNTRTTPANLKGYTLTTASSAATPFTFTQDVIIPAGGAAVIAQAANTPLGSVTPVGVYGTDVRMHDIADSVILTYGDVLIDRVEYDRTAGWRIPRGASIMLDPRADVTGTSFARRAPAATNDNALLWCAGYDAANSSAVATPGKANGDCYSWVIGERDPSTDLVATGLGTQLMPASSTSGTAGTRNDESIGFTFPYFGVPYTKVNLSVFGIASFGPLGSLQSPGRMPTTENNGGIDALFPFWSGSRGNVTGRTNGVYTALVGEEGSRKYMVQWAGHRIGTTTSNGVIDVTLVLHESGEFEYHFHEIGTSGSTTVGIGFQTFGNTYGSSAFIGTTSGTGTTGSELTSLPAAPMSLRFQRRQ